MDLTQKFIYSFNERVKEYIDPKVGKITAGGNFSAFNENWVEDLNTINLIAKHVQKGDGLCAWHIKEGKRTKQGTGCIQAGLIIVDIDNQADNKVDGKKVQQQELSVEQALKLDICNQYLSLAYYSPSTSKEWPRFRLVFALEEPIRDTNFYQWLNREILKEIPGSDIRATQVPNLFYGAHPKKADGIITVRPNFIPKDWVNKKYLEYIKLGIDHAASKGESPGELLQIDTDFSKGIEIREVVSRSVKRILEGEEVDDRSTAMAVAFKEVIGWCNWLTANNLKARSAPIDIVRFVFYNIYDYASELDDKFNRILNSIREPEALLPARFLASEQGEFSIWKLIKTKYPELYTTSCPQETQDQIKSLKAKPKNSILSLDSSDDEFELEETSTPTITSNQKPQEEERRPMAKSTPQSPAQLIQLQNNSRQFSENDIADVIVNNYGENFLFDSSLDEFFAYDEDDGIWFLNDEQHIKRRIVKVLDTFIQSGILPRYSSATVSSVYLILKAKLLKSVRGGRASIWQSSRGKIPFCNGVLDAHSLEFEVGNHKDYYFQTKLMFDYVDKPKCPKILDWLTWAVSPEKVILIRAFCRAVLTGYTTGERFLHLIGPGGSGKSTLQQILVALAGYTGTHTSNLETIETNRFECHSLIGKRLLLLTDEASFSKRLDTLKKLTSSSDTLRAERKYGKEVVNFKPELLVSIASNEHISSSDISSGLERRRLTIVMDKIVDPSARRNLLSVFPDRMEGEFVEELPAFAAWLLDMPFHEMRDVLANPVKHVPTLNDSNLDALIFNNPICAFLSDCCLYAPNSYTPLGGGAFRPSVDESERGMYVKNAYTEIYAAYVNYCKSNGYKHHAKARFLDRLKETVNNIVQIPGITAKYQNGRTLISGLRLKPYDPSTDRACNGENRLPTPIEYAMDATIWNKAFNEHDQPKT